MTHGDIPAAAPEPRSLGLLLVNGFALMAYAAVVESYRAANELSGQRLYRWTPISVNGETCTASNGAMILAERSVGDPIQCDILFVFAGGDPSAFFDPSTFAWLRQIAMTQTVVVGVSAGVYLMAQAGLLDGRRATVHWEYREAFSEAFPRTVLAAGLYVFDGRRVTCAGGMAGMDLATELIRRDHGHDLAVAVSDWFIRSEARIADRPQRLDLRERYGTSNDRVLRVLARMEERIEEPEARDRLAAIAGVSIRQLERLFVRHLGAGVGASYLAIRLAHADRLLRNSTMSATSIAFACGFSSVSHFSRAFKAQFARTPGQGRNMRAAR